MSPLPKISIITPSFNQGQFLEKTILSVLNQNYPNLEYIIVDGGSTDSSVEIIQKYKASITYWVSEADKGQSDALNKGFAKATGDIIAWINSDDWYEANAFNEVINAFDVNDCDVIMGNCRICFESGAESYIVVPKAVTFQTMLRYWKVNFCPPQPSIFFKSKCWKLGTRILDNQLKYAMDLDLWLRLSRNGSVYHLNSILSNYLIHSISKSGSGFENFSEEWELVCYRHLSRATLYEKVLFWAELIQYKLTR